MCLDFRDNLGTGVCQLSKIGDHRAGVLRGHWLSCVKFQETSKHKLQMLPHHPLLTLSVSLSSPTFQVEKLRHTLVRAMIR